MFIMQSNESRLIKAAKRTIRAEATLVIIIIIITSWSVYGLYKIASDGSSDSILGINISKVFNTESSPEQRDKQLGETNNTANQDKESSIIYSQAFNSNQNQYPSDLLLSAQQNFRKHLLEEIIAKRRQLFGGGYLSDKEIINNINQKYPTLINNNNGVYKNMAPYQATFHNNHLDNNLEHLRAARQQQLQFNAPTTIDNLLQPNRTVNNSAEKGKLILLKSLPSLMQINPSLRPDSPSTDLRIASDDQVEINSRLPDIHEKHLLSTFDQHNNDESDRQAAESNENPSEQEFNFGNTTSTTTDSHSNDNDINHSSREEEDNNGSSSLNRDDSSNEQENGNNKNNELEEEAEEQAKDAESSNPNQQDNNDNNNDNDNGDDNRGDSQIEDGSLKETGHAIDEEVDRMTQPSSSDVVSQQDSNNQQPFDYKNTVQFDDSLSTNSAAGIILPTHKQGVEILQTDKKQIVPGSLIARFVDPKAKTSKSKSNQEETIGKSKSKKVSSANYDDSIRKKISSNRLGEEEKKIKRLDLDLQVDHNSLIVTNGAKAERKQANNTNHLDIKSNHQINNEMRIQSDLGDNGHVRKKRKKVDSKKVDDQERDEKLFKLSSNIRDKRSIKESNKSFDYKITAPYEIENYLNRLDFDNLITGQSTIVQQANLIPNNRKPKSLHHVSSESKTQNNKVPFDLNDRSKNGTNNNNILLLNNKNRRSDYDGEDDDGSENGSIEENDPGGNHGDSNQDDNSINYEENDNQDNNNFEEPEIHQNFYKRDNMPRYHYISSNDSDLQNLLAERQLLDNVLNQNRLPAPVQSSSLTISNSQQPTMQLAKTNYTLPTGITTTRNNNNNSPSNDHQTAGSIYTVDHGLLLYPSADEESHHKSKSEAKKKKKHKKMKKKKKMTIAMKKGGHKKKKHKKMEKKFLKEKKFKGAKKGKKMSKGKGGQGGKKGKKLYKDKGFKKKGFKNVYHKEEFGQKKSYFDEYRDKDFKKKWKKFDDKYNYAQMKKWQAKDVKGAKKMKDHEEKFKKYDKSKWKKKYEKQFKEHSAKESKMKKKKHEGF